MTGEQNRQWVREELDRAERVIAAERFWARQEITDALDKLAALGSPTQIAAHLAEQGHRGYRNIAHACPVAAYVQATTGHSVTVTAEAWDRSDWPGWLRYPMPATVAGFVTAFDRGGFPALDRCATEEVHA